MQQSKHGLHSHYNFIILIGMIRILSIFQKGKISKLGGGRWCDSIFCQLKVFLAVTL